MSLTLQRAEAFVADFEEQARWCAERVMHGARDLPQRLYSAGINACVLEDQMMNDGNNPKIWVAVRVQRGFVSDVRAYRDFAEAQRMEQGWRRRMNPDYDETSVSLVKIDNRRTVRRSM